MGSPSPSSPPGADLLGEEPSPMAPCGAGPLQWGPASFPLSHPHQASAPILLHQPQTLVYVGWPRGRSSLDFFVSVWSGSAVNWRGWFVWLLGFCWACCGFFLTDWLADIYFQGDHWQGENTQFTQPQWNTEPFASNRKKINSTWNACMCQNHLTYKVEKTLLWICNIYCTARATQIKYIITRQA